ncbi:MAG TPA: hypothetical protein VMU88_04155 [bacterium]|nr:hypothetical protein [bacterium]
MRALRKLSFLIALAGFSAFAAVSAAENFHHHGALESDDDCSFCSFAQTGSHSSMPTAIPVLVPTLLQLFVLFIFFAFSPSFVSLASCGRSPPDFNPHF